MYCRPCDSDSRCCPRCKACSAPAKELTPRSSVARSDPALPRATPPGPTLVLQDELHLLHVVPDVFTSPASGSIYYCSSPDPETERLLVRLQSSCRPAPAGVASLDLSLCNCCQPACPACCRPACEADWPPCKHGLWGGQGGCVGMIRGAAQPAGALTPSARLAPAAPAALQWSQAKQFFVDNFLEHAKRVGLEDAVCLHLVKESRWAAPPASPPRRTWLRPSAGTCWRPTCAAASRPAIRPPRNLSLYAPARLLSPALLTGRGTRASPCRPPS